MIKNLPDRIFLCGFMGAGKSTLGEELAKKLSLSFLDLDTSIAREAGKSIPEIFDTEGEEAFRSLEMKLLLDVIRNYKGVVALGGGSLQNQHLLDHLKVNGLLIFIETPFSVILERIGNDKNRPLLLREDGSLKEKDILHKELKTLYDRRLPYYEQAELKLKCDGEQTTDELVATLIKKIGYHVSHY